MAKAIFHKGQRVYVTPIGTWAQIEQVIPQWAQGVDEPIRVHYDVGMGRHFSASELDSESDTDAKTVSVDGEWKVIRGQNKWRSAEDCPDHPYPGTHPLIITSERDWGGWRVPGSEYNRDPMQIELQAMMIAKTPTFAGILIALVKQADDMEEDIPDGILVLAQRAQQQLAEAGICATDEVHDAGTPAVFEAAFETAPEAMSPSDSEPVVEAVIETFPPVLPIVTPGPAVQAPPIIREPLVAFGQEPITERPIEDHAPQFGQRARVDAPTPERLLQANG